MLYQLLPYISGGACKSKVPSTAKLPGLAGKHCKTLLAHPALAYKDRSEESNGFVNCSICGGTCRADPRFAALSLSNCRDDRRGDHDRRDSGRQAAFTLCWSVAFRVDSADRGHSRRAGLRLLRWRQTGGSLSESGPPLLEHHLRGHLSGSQRVDLPTSRLLVPGL